jgi:nitroimidazol reductase NimA-like FMN-containing flavoprotein (pyridoxamine 5'-phosphate oxidase superfamily)
VPQGTKGNAPRSARVRVKRFHERGRYDREALDAILDAGVLCHIGFLFDGYPVVTPTLYWRHGGHVFWHGSNASRMLAAAEGADVRLTVTHLDGMVLTRSAYHHSANYRCAMLFGHAERVDGPDEKQSRLRQMFESLFPARWQQLRPVSQAELKATKILSMRIDEFSVKCREGDPQEDDADEHWPVWSGVVPLSVCAGRATASDAAAAKFSAPDFARFSAAPAINVAKTR